MLAAVLAGAVNNALVLEPFPISPTRAPACTVGFGAELMEAELEPELLFDPELLAFEAELLDVEPELPFDPKPLPLVPVRPMLQSGTI